MKKHLPKGFTLLEILLVIAAIGILAAIVIVAINPQRQLAQTRDSVRQSEINTIYNAIEQYLIDTGAYPSGITYLNRDICDTGSEVAGGSTDCSGRVDLRALVPTYIAAIPRDPQSPGGNTGYVVSINPDNERPSISAELSETTDLSINMSSVPSIVTDGLQVYLDAGNSDSYPGSGTTWLDLSGNDNHATLINAFTYDPSNQGSLVFNNNGYANIASGAPLLSSSAYTKTIWFNVTNYNAWNNFLSGGAGGSHAFWLGTSDRVRAGHNGAWSTVVSNTVINLDTWYSATVTFDTVAGWEIYINGESDATSSNTNTFSAGNSLQVGAWNNSSFVIGRISAVKVYDRVLSSEEIQQNFDLIKDRYGL